MKRFGKILVAVMGIALVGATMAQAGYGPSRGHSSRSTYSFGGHGSSYGGHSYGSYSRGWSGSYGRGSSHYDYQPTQIRIERGHIDVQPGHYDRSSSRHHGW